MCSVNRGPSHTLSDGEATSSQMTIRAITTCTVKQNTDISQYKGSKEKQSRCRCFVIYLSKQFKRGITLVNLHRTCSLQYFSLSLWDLEGFYLQTSLSSCCLLLSRMHRWRASIMPEDPESWNGIGASAQTDQTGLAR